MSEIKPESNPLVPSELTIQDQEASGSKETESAIKDASPPTAPSAVAFPEGGMRAWTVVFGSWLLQFTAFGLVNAYGVFNDFYVRTYLNNKSSSDIGWIGSLQVALLLGAGGLVGPLFDKGYLHYLIVSGSLIFVFCSFMLSLTSPHQYYQVILSHGLGVGLGAGLLYLPSLGIVSHYFRVKAPLMLGIVSTGGSVGAVLHPIMLNRLFDSVGFHNAVRINAGMNAGLLIIANLVIRARLPPRPAAKRLLGNLILDFGYDFALLGCLLLLLGLYFPIFFIQLDSVVHNINLKLALNTVSVIQAASTLGRILPQLTLKYVPLPWLHVFCIGANAVLAYTFEAVTNTAGTICFAILYGFFSGAALSLIPAALASFATGVTEVGLRIGVGLIFGALGSLVGLPISGALLSHHQDGQTTFVWWRPSIFSGIIMSASTAAYFTGFLIKLMAKKRSK